MFTKLLSRKKLPCCCAVIAALLFAAAVPGIIAREPAEGGRQNQFHGNLISAGFLSITPEIIQSEIFLESNGYDARDEYNRPIKTASARSNLRAVFIAGISELLMKAEIHSIASAQEILKNKINPAVLAFARALWRAVCKTALTIISQTKRQAALTHLPFILISAAIITSFHISFLIFTPKSRVAPLVLRC